MRLCHSPRAFQPENRLASLQNLSFWDHTQDPQVVLDVCVSFLLLPKQIATNVVAKRITDLLSECSEGWTFSSGPAGRKPGVGSAAFLSGGSRGQFLSRLFQLLEATFLGSWPLPPCSEYITASILTSPLSDVELSGSLFKRTHDYIRPTWVIIQGNGPISRPLT